MSTVYIAVMAFCVGGFVGALRVWDRWTDRRKASEFERTHVDLGGGFIVKRRAIAVTLPVTETPKRWAALTDEEIISLMTHLLPAAEVEDMRSEMDTELQQRWRAWGRSGHE